MNLEQALYAIERYEETVGRKKGQRWADLHSDYDVDDYDIIAHGLRCRQYLRFSQQVDACLFGELPSTDSILVMSKTPALLRACGMNDLPWLHTQKHLINEITPKSQADSSLHGLSVRQLKMLPELLEHPVAVIDNPDTKPGVVCFLDGKDGDGLPLTIAFLPNGSGSFRGRDLNSNFLLSVFGRQGADRYLEFAALESRILYLNKDKVAQLLGREGKPYLPDACKDLPDKMVIRLTHHTGVQRLPPARSEERGYSLLSEARDAGRSQEALSKPPTRTWIAPSR